MPLTTPDGPNFSRELIKRLNERMLSGFVDTDHGGLSRDYSRVIQCIQLGNLDELESDPVGLFLLGMAIEDICPDKKFCLG